jgi:hypothetical protein
MFSNLDAQDKLERMGIMLEKALSDIMLITQYPQNLITVNYETDDDSKRVFEKTDNKFITLTIEFKDPKGEIRSARKESVEAAEVELLKELEELKKEKTKYGG